MGDPSCKVPFLPRDAFKFLNQKKHLKEEAKKKKKKGRRAAASLEASPRPTAGHAASLSLTKVVGLRVSIHLPLQALCEGF